MITDTADDYPYRLGSFHRNITTSSSRAQKWFDRGVTWTYAFHHEEAARCFEKAIDEDPACAMAYWGLSFALGPNYNKPWEFFDAEELSSTLARIQAANEKAKTHALKATKVEKALVHALQVRVPKKPNHAAFRACNQEFRKAMKDVYQNFSIDLDVTSWYVESMMNLSAWNLWDLRTGHPTPGSHSLEARWVLETALRQNGVHEHPGILHLYIHLMEMSPTPEVALVAADRLRKLVPDAGHLIHMPSHLDILIGDYRRAVDANRDAYLADEKYFSKRRGHEFYSFYRMHNYHSLVYAAMFAGQSQIALDTAFRMEAALPESLLEVKSPPLADWLENFKSVRIHVLVRFGRWEDLIALPMPNDRHLHCVTTAMIHYGKGVAYAATGEVEKAQEEQAALRAAVIRIPESRIAGDFPNKSNVVLQVGMAMLEGEIEYRKGNFDVAFRHLETAVERDDSLTYAEPWPWMQPTRHAYAALLMEQGRVDEAAAVYKADLGFDDALPRARQHPNNIWALHGYHECLVKLGKVDEGRMVEQQLRIAQAVADVTVKSSCYCRRIEKARI